MPSFIHSFMGLSSQCLPGCLVIMLIIKGHSLSHYEASALKCMPQPTTSMVGEPGNQTSCGDGDDGEPGNQTSCGDGDDDHNDHDDDDEMVTMTMMMRAE